MSTVCLGEEEGHGHLHLNQPRFVRYIARVRRPYERKYKVLGASANEVDAYLMLAQAMTDRQYKRGDVLGDEGPESYYEPTLLIEMVR